MLRNVNTVLQFCASARKSNFYYENLPDLENIANLLTQILKIMKFSKKIIALIIFGCLVNSAYSQINSFTSELTNEFERNIKSLLDKVQVEPKSKNVKSKENDPSFTKRELGQEQRVDPVISRNVSVNELQLMMQVIGIRKSENHSGNDWDQLSKVFPKIKWNNVEDKEFAYAKNGTLIIRQNKFDITVKGARTMIFEIQTSISGNGDSRSFRDQLKSMGSQVKTICLDAINAESIGYSWYQISSNEFNPIYAHVEWSVGSIGSEESIKLTLEPIKNSCTTKNYWQNEFASSNSKSESKNKNSNQVTNNRNEVTATNITKPPITNKLPESRSESVFNLKGFHLNMSRGDVKKLIPNAKFEKVDTYDGKEFSGYQCGVVAQQTPNSCAFTYAGEEITGISVRFWGDYPFEIQFYFGEYRNGKHGVASVYLDRKMRAALDTKYVKQSNTTGPNGNLGSIWESGSEFMKFEYVRDKGFYSNSLSLNDNSYFKQFDEAQRKHNSLQNKIDKQNKDKKVLSDM